LASWCPFDLAQGILPQIIPKSQRLFRIVNSPAKILVVDDTPRNVKLLADLLAVKGYGVVTAGSGKEALALMDREQPDLILLDVVMPEMSGYEVCRKIRQNAATAMLPVVMVTALDPAEERVKGIDAGADDFLTKPINQAELLARVKSLLRIKNLHDTIQSQAADLADWNKNLELRVQAQLKQLERLERLKRFFSPQLVEMIVSGGAEDPLKTHRRELTVVYLDLRGFTAFAEAAEPEEVMDILHEYHAAMGKLIVEYEGTLEHFAGDGMMIFFNDPVPIAKPAEQAVRMTVAMREQVKELTAKWRKLGHELDFGVGIAQGYATIGAIGYEGRWEYGAIGSVPNMAARLCGEAKPGEILVTQRLLGNVDELVESEPVGELSLKGFHRPVPAFRILGPKNAGRWS
jgi:adenylate cyclase